MTKYKIKSKEEFDMKRATLACQLLYKRKCCKFEYYEK